MDGEEGMTNYVFSSSFECRHDKVNAKKYENYGVVRDDLVGAADQVQTVTREFCEMNEIPLSLYFSLAKILMKSPLEEKKKSQLSMFFCGNS